MDEDSITPDGKEGECMESEAPPFSSEALANSSPGEVTSETVQIESAREPGTYAVEENLQAIRQDLDIITYGFIPAFLAVLLCVWFLKKTICRYLDGSM